MTAAVSAVPDPPADDEAKSLTYHGQTFRMHPDGVSEFAQLEFAEMVTSGGTDDMADMAALLRLVLDAIHEDDRLAFRAACRTHRATQDEMIALITSGTAGDERPFERRNSSTPGETPTEPKSPSTSEATVTLLGRADARHILRMREQALASV